MLSLGRVEELQVTESKEQQQRERKKVHNGHIESVCGERGRGGTVSLFKASCFRLIPFEESGSVKLSMLRH